MTQKDWLSTTDDNDDNDDNNNDEDYDNNNENPHTPDPFYSCKDGLSIDDDTDEGDDNSGGSSGGGGRGTACSIRVGTDIWVSALLLPTCLSLNMQQSPPRLNQPCHDRQ
jgi:hypothetical protein